MFRLFSQYVSTWVVVLAVSDAVAATAALACSLRFAYGSELERWNQYAAAPGVYWRSAAICVCFLVCAYYNGAYLIEPRLKFARRFARVARAVGAAALILALLYLFWPSLSVGRPAFLPTMGLTLAASTLARGVYAALWRSTGPRRNVAILGAGKMAAAVAAEVKARPDLGLDLVGFLEAPGARLDEQLPAVRIGETSEVEEAVARYRIDKLIVALDEQRGVLPVRELLRLRMRGLQIEDAHQAMAALAGRIPLETVQATWFIFSGGFRRSRSVMALKRCIDVGLSSFGLLLSAPLMALVAAAIQLDSRGPSLFRQLRVGRGGKCFNVLKFRTMRTDAEADGVAQWARKDDPRITRLGRWLRRYRLDELPQFFNVIRGEMSFVGPRPERPEFVEKLRLSIPYYDERHTLRPGITGWAQVRYRYGASSRDSLRKLEYDLFYLKSVGFLFDCAIVFETARIVLLGRGR